MHVALFLPCYVDQLYPDVGLATVELLPTVIGWFSNCSGPSSP